MAEDRTAPAAETEENLSDILRIRREKLAELRANGKDPFVIRRFDKTHDFKTIRDAFDTLEGGDVTVAGRILSRRDMGKANFIDGTFKGRDGEAALVEIGGKTFSIPAPGKMEGVEVGGACCLTVRPESFLLTKDAGALPGTVSRATYYGAKIEYEVMLNEQPIIVEVYNPQLTERFSVGDAVTMSLIEGCVRVLK